MGIYFLLANISRQKHLKILQANHGDQKRWKDTGTGNDKLDFNLQCFTSFIKKQILHYLCNFSALKNKGNISERRVIDLIEFKRVMVYLNNLVNTSFYR